MNLERILQIREMIHVADIGAAYIAEEPPYKSLLERGLARLSACDADSRQQEKLVRTYGGIATAYTEVLGDGSRQTLYLASPESGMSSLLRPSDKHLKFFNGFSQFGKIEEQQTVESKRLDDIPALQGIDFLKIDVQGSELMILEHGKKALSHCVAVQLEVSFFPLYERQPTFGAIDMWMRSNGLCPHCFVEIKKWSIAPTIRDKDFRVPFNQLLEADIVYIKDPVDLARLSSLELKKLALIALYANRSFDLVVHLLLELERRHEISSDSHAKFVESLNHSSE